MMKKVLSFSLVLALFCTLSLDAQNTWTQKANYGGGNRAAACGFAIGDTGYIMTGENTDSDYFDVWAWSQSTNTWSKRNIFPNGKRVEHLQYLCTVTDTLYAESTQAIVSDQ